MTFEATKLPGAYLIDLTRLADDRGFFACSYHAVEFERHSVEPRIAQVNLSSNPKRGTLRGMHYQLAPRAEAKTIRVVRGAIYDVGIDLRPDSPTFRQWVGVELSARNLRALHLPVGFAHGFLTLEDETDVLYQVSEYYSPEHYRGIRWNDPEFAVEWPLGEPSVIAKRDATYPDFSSAS